MHFPCVIRFRAAYLVATQAILALRHVFMFSHHGMTKAKDIRMSVLHNEICALSPVQMRSIERLQCVVFVVQHNRGACVTRLLSFVGHNDGSDVLFPQRPKM